MGAIEPGSAGGDSRARRSTQREALRPGTRLGDFEIVRTLGSGGFGTVYLARDRLLQREVAVKEYLPAQLAFRAEGLRVAVRSASAAAAYAAGLRSFVNEARILARFDHPAVVKVHRFWEANGTAYMVMPWVQGPTLREVRRALKSPPTEAWLRALLDPLLDALAMLHAQGIYHRDIAPDNILLPAPGEPVLLDFGAARRLVGDHTQTITAVLKPSFAPIEQYAEASQLRQGPWTDLYALGAVMVYMMTAVAPPPSTVRSVHDELRRATEPPPPGVSASFLAAIHWALAVRPQDRPQCVQELRNALDGRITPPPPVETTPVHVARGSPAIASAPASQALASRARLSAGLAPPVAVSATGSGTPQPCGVDPLAVPAWAPTVRLVQPLSMPPWARPLIQPARRPPRAMLAAAACAAALVAGVAILLFAGGPLDPAPATWQALGRHAAQWTEAPASAEAGDRHVTPQAMVPAIAVAGATMPSPPAALPAAQEPAAQAASEGPMPRPLSAGAAPGEADAASEADADGHGDGDVDSDAGLDAAAPAAAGLRRAAADAVPRTATASAARAGVAPVMVKTGGTRVRAAATRKPLGVGKLSARPIRWTVGPREACGERSLIGMAICLNGQCQSPRFRRHPDCVELRRHWEERRARVDQHP